MWRAATFPHEGLRAAAIVGSTLFALGGTAGSRPFDVVEVYEIEGGSWSTRAIGGHSVTAVEQSGSPSPKAKGRTQSKLKLKER